MDLCQIIEETLRRPPVPYNPTQQTLKGWVMFCLRNRGFKVTSTPKYDFEIETRDRKVSFNVTENPAQVDDSTGWIVRNPVDGDVSVIEPKA